MARATDTLGILKQNLLDAGCSESTVSECMTLAQNDKWEKITSVLEEQKKALLKCVHSGQKQIDCLDFLTYRIKKDYLKEINK